MHLTWRALLGEVPREEPHLLPEHAAQLARNVKLGTGAARPLKNPAFVADLAKPGTKKTIYRYGQALDSDTQHWFHWTTDVDVCRGPVADDTQERVYFTGDGLPSATDATIATATGSMPSAAYRIGLPRPASAPLVAVTGDPLEGATAVQIVVAYQYVNSWAEPGPISAISTPIDYKPGQTLEVSNLEGAPTGAYNTTAKRIYVAQPDESGNMTLRYWKQVTIGTEETSGAVDFTLLGEAVWSPSLIQPPDDLFGIMLHPNRFLVGFTKRRICRSEVNRPFGWPLEYQDPIGDDVVGGAIIGQSIVICTKGKTYLATGQDPLNQAINDLAGYQPCVAKRSIRALPFAVLYASPDGLVAVNAAGPLVVVSEDHFTREQWQAFKPESMHAVVHDNRYIVWYDTGTVRGGLIFEFSRDGAIRSLTRTDIHVTAAWADHRRDDLFVALATDNDVHKWDAGSVATMLWRSRETRFWRPQVVGAARVLADAYPVTFRLFEVVTDPDTDADAAVQVDAVTVADAESFTLSADDRLRRVYWEVEATHRVTQVEIASSTFDLRR